ncbi:MAG: hypothetical protein WA160_10410 [Pseudobdellovibrio sp.]
MKTKIALPLSILALSLILLNSCQKAPADKNMLVASDKSAEADISLKMPDTVCSEEIKKIVASINSTQIQMSQTPSADQADQQVDKYRQINDQFIKENITACLKSPNPKSKENSYYKSVFATYSKSLNLWAKKINEPNRSKDAEKEITFSFNKDAAQLIQPNTTNDLTFISNGEIKTGKDLFMHDTKSGAVTCLITTQNANMLDNLNLKFIMTTADSNPATDIGFEFNGSRSMIVMQDSNKSLHSMLCLNLKLSSEKSKMVILAKIFGAGIRINEKENAKKTNSSETPSEISALLNKDVAPTAIPSETVPPTATGDTKNNDTKTEALTTPAGPTAIIDHTLDKGSAVTKEIITETKIAASQVIKEGQIAMAETIEKAGDKAGEIGSKIANNAINSAQKAIIKTIKSPFVAVGNYIANTATTVSNFASSTWTSAKSYLPDWMKSSSK